MNALKLAVAVLVPIAAGLGYGWRQETEKSKAAVQSLDVRHAAELVKRHDEMQDALAAQAAQHQQAIQTLNAEFDKKLADFQQEQRNQLASAYREFDSIFEGNKKTIDYINLLEDKVKAGQAISKAEVERLAIITTGISYLQKQYARPLEQFSELAAYFEKQASQQPEKPKGGFFRRVFSKSYKEEEKQFIREEAMKQAYEQAQAKFSSVYATAQRHMAAVNLNADEQVKKLYALIDDKQQANKENLAGFFDQARKALRTHQEVLKFEPENLPQPPAVPRP
ncbi:MAG: hypothetical protein K1X78_02810 [Verrucomicrobiaceae bacterium]|nr:hypothetical protein [Verrucomicrobiaceae bacterium]